MIKTAIYDACVLYPASLRSFLMWIRNRPPKSVKGIIDVLSERGLEQSAEGMRELVDG